MSYDRQKQLNIERNKKLLQELGLDKPFFEAPAKSAPKPKATKKRKVPETPAESSTQPEKVSRLETATDVSSEDTARRRSQRHAGRKVDYTAVAQKKGVPAFAAAKKAGVIQGRETGKRIHDPKTFGAIPGIAVGTWWASRENCSLDAIHAPWVGGISCGSKGAYSVCLSGGYDDDVDLGYAFTYTGSGGRDLKGTKAAPKNLRTAPQSSDQTFENSFNKGLKISSENQKPVRVVRGYKLPSKYAPSEGYRYDGLYRVEKAWLEKGLNAGGHLVCKYAFKRLDGQPPLLESDKSTQDEADADEEEEDPNKSDESTQVEAEEEEDPNKSDESTQAEAEEVDEPNKSEEETS